MLTCHCTSGVGLPLAAAVISLLVAGVSGYSHVVWLLVFFIVYRLFQDYVLSPYLLSSGVQLHPLLVLFGAVALLLFGMGWFFLRLRG